jgi:hypothetical protein
MQSPNMKPVAVNVWQVTVEMLMLTARAFAAGLAVSLTAGLLIVGLVALAS